jgi:hypothetical protein
MRRHLRELLDVGRHVDMEGPNRTVALALPADPLEGRVVHADMLPAQQTIYPLISCRVRSSASIRSGGSSRSRSGSGGVIVPPFSLAAITFCRRLR